MNLDRAAIIATAITQIHADAALTSEQRQFRIEQCLRDEIADIEQQIATDREVADE